MCVAKMGVAALPLSLDLLPGALLQPCSSPFWSAYLCLKQVRKGHWSRSGLHSRALMAGLDMSKTAVGQPLRVRSSVREAQPRAQGTPCLAQDDLGRKGERGPAAAPEITSFLKIPLPGRLGSDSLLVLDCVASERAASYRDAMGMGAQARRPGVGHGS
jgi:hypothetical protein